MNTITLNLNDATEIEVFTIAEALSYISPKLLSIGAKLGKSVYFYDADTDIVHYHTGITGKLSNSARAVRNWPNLKLQGVLYQGILYEEEITISEFNERHQIRH